jgi:hypothetical protein
VDVTVSLWALRRPHPVLIAHRSLLIAHRPSARLRALCFGILSERPEIRASRVPPLVGHWKPRAAWSWGYSQRQMTNDDIAYLRLLADWHDRQAEYLLLTVPAGQHDQGRFHYIAAARLSRLADVATMSRPAAEASVDRLPRPRGQEPGASGNS